MASETEIQTEEKAQILTADRLSKHFGPVKALDRVSCSIEGSSIFGLIGSNGAGKSTFLRLAAGVYKPTAGRMLYRGQIVYENARAKQEIQFVSDQPFFHFDTLYKMSKFNRSLYLGWDQALYEELLAIFPLGENDRLDRMSRGMQRQAAVLLAIACNPSLLLLDEAFDGLDPVMRQNLKRILARQVADRHLTVLIASQNLRELEDFCDHVGLLHQGGLLFVEELDKLRLSIVKIQAAFPQPVTESHLRERGLDILQFRTRGSLIEILARSSEEEIHRVLEELHPLLLDVLPLSLEEVFIYELSLKSYAVSDLLA
ncbi:MAG TPA: ABC transporter ATP-binding protein [Bacillota bacterium]|jgi:ABC-2 type transport system ATP-binding protein|nr:ABC transporter ATP-binding protein [Fastidiosipila sp.]HPX93063.1 ABC transporter ATP-binding protein [Bacillota bacterium]HQB80864.1 ABC transporter ATP-binding protein [Bacillota bacterium]